MAPPPTVYRSFAFEYGCDARSLPRNIAERFLPLELDANTRSYVDRTIERPHGAALLSMHRALCRVVSDFDVNGILEMYPMHLLGTEQWARLLGHARPERHLDVGAGSGDVTASIAPLVGDVVTTETSWAMARKLRRRGFTCIRADLSEAPLPGGGYDLITCLNVLDRCARPRSLLTKLRDGLAPDGRLILAVPLPYRPFFYDGPRTLDPVERLPIHGSGWEDSLASLVENVLTPLGLDIVSVSRAPYLAGGDVRRPLYSLDDAVMVCRRRPGGNAFR